MVQDTAIFTVADQLNVTSGAIFNDLERPQTHISRSRHYLTLSVSETVRDIWLQRNTNRDLTLLTNVILNDLE